MLVTVIQSAAWQPLATLGAAFVAALLGSWGGAEFAMRRFRRERAFDRRLVWSEQMARRLAEVKLNIEVATTLQEDATATDHERGQAWSTVNQDYLKLILDEALAPLAPDRTSLTSWGVSSRSSMKCQRRPTASMSTNCPNIWTALAVWWS